MGRARFVSISLFTLFTASTQAGTAALQASPQAARVYDLAAREAQFQAISAMPQVDVEYGSVGRIRSIEGHTGIYLPGIARLKQGENATELLQRLRGLLMASGSESLLCSLGRDHATPPGRCC
jgi:hypothetical protein